MQNLTKTAHIIGSTVVSSIAYAGVIAALFLFVGVSVAHADTNYVVDSSGTCGTICQNLQNYLDGKTAPSYDYSKYSSTDVPFFDAYTGGNGSGNTTGTTAGTNGSYYPNTSTGSNASNYGGNNAAVAPYLVYNYAPTAAPKYTNTGLNDYNSQYLNPPVYNYYGASSPTTVKSYSQTAYGQQGLYGQSQGTYQPYGYTNPTSTGSGFRITSGY